MLGLQRADVLLDTASIFLKAFTSIKKAAPLCNAGILPLRKALFVLQLAGLLCIEALLIMQDCYIGFREG